MGEQSMQQEHASDEAARSAPSDSRDTSAAVQVLAKVEAEIGTVLVGQSDLVRRLLIALLCDGHCLLEGLPGLAKTTVVKALAASLHAGFSRVQFTPDLLPADIIGTQVFEGGQFTTHKGPIFANLVLADEINRAPAKVQSALLEAMQEWQVTIGEESYPLPRPFMVLATQNPLEQEGTYPLPEAQTDRFIMKLLVDYPKVDEEREMLDRALAQHRPQPQAVVDLEQLAAAKLSLEAIHLDERLRDYCVRLVRATRSPEEHSVPINGLVAVGASPRAVLSLAACARAHALIEGQTFVTPHDIKAIAPDVLRHRIIPSFAAEADGISPDQIVRQLLDHCPVP